MRLFRSEEDVQGWAAGEGRPVGAIVPVPQLQRLARAWYGDRLDPAWRPRTVEQSQRILRDAGLTGAFWALG
ncbi:MAG: hypothetical protein QOH43_4089 [Solirubrobacteraceae bacterium]|jgi:hypothetical protein|nr:hypothetical protein [Solirubrobacteraceae bacterium]